jgi:ABC-type polysaccharide/polyol phosphate export permease
MRVISVLSDAHRLNHLASFGHIESFFISSHGDIKVRYKQTLLGFAWAICGLF